jgi:hypothetical protein
LLTAFWLAVPQATKWQGIGDEMDAAPIFTRLGEAAGWGEAAVLAQLSASALLWALMSVWVWL